MLNNFRMQKMLSGGNPIGIDGENEKCGKGICLCASSRKLDLSYVISSIDLTCHIIWFSNDCKMGHEVYTVP